MIADPVAYIKARFKTSPALPDMVQDVHVALAEGRTAAAAVQYTKRRWTKYYRPGPETPPPEEADPGLNPRELASQHETAEILGLVFSLALARRGEITA